MHRLQRCGECMSANPATIINLVIGTIFTRIMFPGHKRGWPLIEDDANPLVRAIDTTATTKSEKK